MSNAHNELVEKGNELATPILNDLEGMVTFKLRELKDELQELRDRPTTQVPLRIFFRAPFRARYRILQVWCYRANPVLGILRPCLTQPVHF